MPSRRRRRRLLLGVGILAVVLVALVGWAAWSGWQVRGDLKAAADAAPRLQQALTDGDQELATSELDSLQQHATAAADRTDGLTWRAVEHLPVVGDDATAIAEVSQTMARLADDGLAPIVAVAGDLDAGSFAPRKGRLPVARIRALQEPVAQADEAFATARDELGEVDLGGLAEPIAAPLADLTDRVDEASTTLHTADLALGVLPGMLGARGERDYLLIFQNNAEIRASGGIPGAMSLVSADRGRLDLGEPLASDDFPVVDGSVIPLTAEQRRLYGNQFGSYVQDVNFTPDFPLTAELLRAHLARQDREIDGVLSLDPVAVSYLLGATGPITVDAVRLTADNAVDELLHRTYLRLSDPAEQDEFFAHVAAAVFDRVVSGSGDSRDLLSALARATDEGRLLVHSFHPEEQQPLAGTWIAGELPTTATSRPQVSVALNDATGAKMSYFLEYDVDVTASACTGRGQELTGTLRLTSTAPADAADLPVYVTGGGHFGVPAGAQIVVADLYGPIGGEVTDARLDGKKTGLKPLALGERPVAQVPVYLEPGKSAEVTWTMTSGAYQPGGVDIRVTPGIQPDNKSSVAPSSCG